MNRTVQGGTAVLEPPQPVAPAVPAPAPAPKKPGRVSFGKAQVNKAEDTGTKYPVFNDATVGAQVIAIAARIKQRAAEMDALEGAQSTDKAELKMFVTPFYFRTNKGKSEVPSSIAIPYPANPTEGYESGELLVAYTNRYPKVKEVVDEKTKAVKESAICAVLGQEQMEKLFRQSFSMTLNGDALPPGKEQEVVDAVLAVLEQHGVDVANALQVDEELCCKPDFHTARHTMFTPEQNIALDSVWPIVSQVKTKGRASTKK